MPHRAYNLFHCQKNTSCNASKWQRYLSPKVTNQSLQASATKNPFQFYFERIFKMLQICHLCPWSVKHLLKSSFKWFQRLHWSTAKYNRWLEKVPLKVSLTLISKMLLYFVAHLVFEISVCFGFQLLSLLQAWTKEGSTFRFKNFIFVMVLSFVKIVPIFNILIIRNGAHLNFAMGATLHSYATGSTHNLLYCYILLGMTLWLASTPTMLTIRLYLPCDEDHTISGNIWMRSSSKQTLDLIG